MTLELEMNVNPFWPDKDGPFEARGQRIEAVSPAVDEVVEDMINMYRKVDPSRIYAQLSDHVENLKVAALFPSQIDLLLQKIILQDKRQHVETATTGLFLSRLIRESYCKGYNDFILNLQDRRILHLCDNIHGELGKELNVTLMGDVEAYCGDHSSYCHIHITGSAANTLGFYSENCSYTLLGNGGPCCCDGMTSSGINIHGTIGVGFGINSDGCRYMTPNPGSFEMMKRFVMPNKGNKIILTDAKGEIIEEAVR